MFSVQKNFFLYLIIYTLFSGGVLCQNLRLDVAGKTNAETAVIDSVGYRQWHNDYKSVKTEVDSLGVLLSKIGFIENKVSTLNKINDSIFKANFDLKQRYSHITVYYDSSQIDTEFLKRISGQANQNYFTIKLSNVEGVLSRINAKQSELGQPFSKAQLTRLKINEQNKLTANLTLSAPEKTRHIDTIIIKGYEKFPKAYLKHYLKIKPKQVFSLNKIRTKTETLNHLRFAKETKPAEVLFSKDSTALYLYLEKTKSNAFDGFLGFGTNEDTNKLEFDGYVNLNLVNNLNFGESFALLYKSGENDKKTFETNLELPFLFNSPIGLNAQLRIFKRDSSYSTVNQFAKLHYQINAKHKIYAGIVSAESSNLLNTTSNLFIQDYKTNYYSFGYQYQQLQLNHTLFPIKTYGLLDTNFGKRKQPNNVENQSLFNVNAFNIFNLNTNNSIFLKVSGAMLNSSAYLENELLLLGGINSIRGFEENSILASLYGILNTEYRYQISNAIYIHSITDFGYYENKLNNSKEKIYGFGFGFGILTNAGLLRFNYANGKNENTSFKLLNSKTHISLTTNF
ncbi:MAG: hypothetical protein ACK5NB_00205 [Flavobacteriaceae bacterium]